MVHLADGMKYLSKYITKASDLTQKGTKTLALTWAFHKRAYPLGTNSRSNIPKVRNARLDTLKPNSNLFSNDT
jgi:hypothetical protein